MEGHEGLKEKKIGFRPKRKTEEKEGEEKLTEKVVEIKRVQKKTPGGSKLSFTALVVVGDKKGRVGVSLGKALTVRDAIGKGTKKAKRVMFKVPLKGRTIPHDVFVKLGAAKVLLRPAPKGTGIVAGGSARFIVEVVGIEDITVKLLGTANKASNVYATIEALKRLKSI